MQVHFHPDNPKQFLSASEDGLVAVFDFSATVDEEDSFKVCTCRHAIGSAPTCIPLEMRPACERLLC